MEGIKNATMSKKGSDAMVNKSFSVIGLEAFKWKPELHDYNRQASLNSINS
jgi:hypothetical protein